LALQRAHLRAALRLQHISKESSTDLTYEIRLIA
jgi:hypothetical protein